eukprot:3854926-Pyramimonas_sp.AAC.1
MREETDLHDLTLPNVSYCYDNPQHETRHGDTDSYERDIHCSQYRQEVSFFPEASRYAQRPETPGVAATGVDNGLLRGVAKRK